MRECHARCVRVGNPAPRESSKQLTDEMKQSLFQLSNIVI